MPFVVDITDHVNIGNENANALEVRLNNEDNFDGKKLSALPIMKHGGII